MCVPTYLCPIHMQRVHDAELRRGPPRKAVELTPLCKINTPYSLQGGVCIAYTPLPLRDAIYMY